MASLADARPNYRKETILLKEFQGKVAVVTGAASGIGRALAGKSAQEGMKVVPADIEEQALMQASQELCTWTKLLAAESAF